MIERVLNALPQLLDMVYVITVSPADIPVTWPETASTLAPELLLLQLPEGKLAVSTICAPSHRDMSPDMSAGTGSGVMVSVADTLTEPQELVMV